MNYDFVTNRHKIFNPLFYKLKNSKKRIIVNVGGAGSGKSVASHQLELLNQLPTSCNFDTLFLRKYSTDIYDSCFKLLENLARKYHCIEEFNWIYGNKRQIENKSTGHRIIFKGLDDTEKIKSIVGIKRIQVEEASQIEFEDFLELNRRARGYENIQIILNLNPININHWIKTKLIDNPAYQDDIEVIYSNYKDNKFLTDQDKKQLEMLKDIDYNHYRIYCLGEWGIDDPEKLFAKDYKESVHFGKSFQELYDPNLDIYLAWDFNITNTCLVIQNNGNQINVLKEYHIKGYDLPMYCEVIKQDFPNHLFFINGDASGRAGSALTRGNESGYEIIKTCLGLIWDQFYVPGSNPSHLNSRLLTNIVFKFADVNISNECKELNTDLLSCEIDEKGSLDPYKKKHAERSHHLDPLRYHFNAHHDHKLKDLGLKLAE